MRGVSRSVRRVLPVAVLSTLLLVAGCGGSPSAKPVASGLGPSGGAAASAEALGPPCTGAAPPARWKHVLWIWFENTDFGTVAGAEKAPYLTALMSGCGQATDYHGVAHPSLPNYVAAVSGSTHGISDDRSPAAHRLEGPSLFSQVSDAGRQWRAYQESIPAPCALTAHGDYAVKHNPAAYFTGLREQCRRKDVDLQALVDDAKSGHLPAFAFVTPNLCHDMHDCSVREGDDWLQHLLPTILAGPDYRSGDTAVVIAWDEDESHDGNHIPFVVVAPSVVPGSVLTARVDHYALLATTEEMLGLPRLGSAQGAPLLTPLLDGTAGTGTPTAAASPSTS